MLSIKNIIKQFGDKKILNNINLNVKRGEIAFLLGSSGVGKSTLLRVLNNLVKPDKGAIELDGKTLDLETVNKNHTTGMVFQHFNLFDHLTAEQNITLALEKVQNKSNKQAKKIAHELLEKYGLADKKDSYIADLSGGQKQRLALARTLALQPTIICLDEPTSALDPLLTSHVAKNISDLAAQGYIVLVATHDIGLLEKLACTIHLMKNGKIIESANSKDYFKHKEQYPLIDTFVKGAIEE